ncbi:MAG: T9SS type A sorting domain-containing protein [Bacteroidetes bacterium]|nr:MAG: T9SS type A sorting domain-containing protein [Bacteroidota bacterium]
MKLAYYLSFGLISLSFSAFAQNNWIPENEYRVYEGPNKVTGVKFTQYDQRGDTAFYANFLQYHRINGSALVSGNLYPLEHIMVDSHSSFGRMVVTPTHSLILNYFWVPNMPQPNSSWIASKQGPNLFYAIETGQAFTFSNRYQDSLLTLTVQVQDSNQVGLNHFYNGLQIVYGQTHGLVSFSQLFRAGGDGNYELIQSPQINLVNLPDSLAEMLPYEAGSEIHSTFVRLYSNKVDSTYRIRKTLQVQQNGNVLSRTDSVFDFQFSYTVSGPDAGQNTFLKKEFYTEDVEIDLSLWESYSFSKPVTCLYGFSSDSNRTFDYWRADNWTSLGLSVSANINSDMQYTPNPPYSYFALGSSRIEEETNHHYFPFAGGPYLSFNSPGGQSIELPVYSKSSLGVFGDPLPSSLYIASVNQAQLASLNIYPNPSAGVFQIKFPQEANWDIQVMDMKGQLLFSSDVNGTEKTLNLNHLSDGVYLIRAQSSLGISQNSICVQH